MKRRFFTMGLVLAPAICHAEWLMPIKVARPVLWADGVHNDTLAFQAWLDGRRVLDGRTMLPIGNSLRDAVIHAPDGIFWNDPDFSSQGVVRAHRGRYEIGNMLLNSGKTPRRAIECHVSTRNMETWTA